MSWWPFAKRGARIDDVPAVVLPVALPDDLGVFAHNDACIKLWLPERLMQALDGMSARQGMSRPDVLRWLLFEHVFGRPALDQLNDWKRRQEEIRRAKARESTQNPNMRFSPPRIGAQRSVTVQLLGKSVEDFKLWLPARLKNELEQLAATERMGISDYLRKTLVRILLGESFYHRWQEAIGKLPKEVRQFEQGN